MWRPYSRLIRGKNSTIRLLTTGPPRCSPEGSAAASSAGTGPSPGQPPRRPDDGPGDAGAPPKPPPGYDGYRDPADAHNAGAVGRWPLKPGVLVHSKQQLLRSTAGKIVGAAENDDRAAAKPRKCGGKPGKPSSSSSAFDGLTLANETQSERAARIRRMMIGGTSGGNDDLRRRLSPPPAPPARGLSADRKTACNAGEASRLRTGRFPRSRCFLERRRKSMGEIKSTVIETNFSSPKIDCFFRLKKKNHQTTFLIPE